MSVYALKDTDWSWDDADEGRPVIVIADTPEDAVRIATEKHIRDCPGSGCVTWDIARLNLVAFGDAEWGSDNTPNFEPLTYYDEGVNGLPDTPPDASAIREALDGADEVEIVARLLWARFSSSHVQTWEEETHRSEYRIAAADCLSIIKRSKDARHEAAAFLYKHGDLTHSAAHKAIELLAGNGFTISRAALAGAKP